MKPKTKRKLKWVGTQYATSHGFIWKAVGAQGQWNSCITRNGKDSTDGHITTFYHQSKQTAMDWVEKRAREKGTK